MRFSPLVDRIAGEQTGAWRVHAEGVRRREAGHDVIFLTVGDPDQPAPAAVLDATIEALRRNRTGYSPIIGYPQVREAVAARMQRRTGRPCTADNVVLTPGHAVEAPRFHYQGQPDEIAYERSGLTPETAAALTGMGYKLVDQRQWGAVELIAIASGRLHGVNDPRRAAGAAVGY